MPQQIIVGHAQNAQSVLIQISRALLILFVLTDMAFTVKFHDQRRFRTIEICHERPNRVLTSELVAIKLSIPQYAPQDALGCRAILAQ